MEDIRIRARRVSELIPCARNVRTHSDEQVGQIAKSIQAFGFINPIIIDETGMILAGHGRVLAAERLGLDIVPTVGIEHLSEREKREFMLADNKIATNAEWDRHRLAVEIGELSALDGFDNDLVGFSLDEIGKLTGIPDYSTNNKEVDVDDFGELVELTLKFPLDTYRAVRQELAARGDSPESGLLAALSL